MHVWCAWVNWKLMKIVCLLMSIACKRDISNIVQESSNQIPIWLAVSSLTFQVCIFLQLSWGGNRDGSNLYLIWSAWFDWKIYLVLSFETQDILGLTWFEILELKKLGLTWLSQNLAWPIPTVEIKRLTQKKKNIIFVSQNVPMSVKPKYVW